MNFTLRSFCITLLILSLPSCWHHTPESKIVESDAITSVYQYIKPEEYNRDTLVIFDIDNTLATQPTDLDSDHWVDAMMKKKMLEGLSSQDALLAILPAYWQIQHHTWLVPIEPETVGTLKTLQEKGVTVIALTARDIFILHRTLEQLERLGINFSRNSPQKAMEPYGMSRPTTYLEGILFVCGRDKGKSLLHWLNQMNYKPSKIIFVDDKLKNIHSVEQALKKENYPFIGIRYGYCDDRVKNIDLQETEKEYQQFVQDHPDSRPLKITPMTVTS